MSTCPFSLDGWCRCDDIARAASDLEEGLSLNIADGPACTAVLLSRHIHHTYNTYILKDDTRGGRVSISANLTQKYISTPFFARGRNVKKRGPRGTRVLASTLFV